MKEKKEPLPSSLCVCGHPLSIHPHGKDCVQIIEPKKGIYCKCAEFREKHEKTS